MADIVDLRMNLVNLGVNEEACRIYRMVSRNDVSVFVDADKIRDVNVSKIHCITRCK